MSRINFIDVAMSVIDEATKQFSPFWSVNEEKYDIFKQYCSAFDILAEDTDGEIFEVQVDDERMTIGVSLECEDLAVDSQNNVFLSLTQRAMSVEFSVTQSGCLKMSFVFPSIWDKTY